METCRVLNLFKRKAERFFEARIDIFKEKFQLSEAGGGGTSTKGCFKLLQKYLGSLSYLYRNI